MNSKSMSSAIRLQSGNTIVHEAYQDYKGANLEPDRTTNSRIREVTPEGVIVWNYYTEVKGELPGAGGTPGMTGLNPAKIMHYHRTHPGIQKLLGLTGAHPVSVKSVSGMKVIRTAGRIRLTRVKGAHITLFSLQGRRIAAMTPNTDEVSIPAKSLRAAAFVLKVKMPSGETVSRCIEPISL